MATIKAIWQARDHQGETILVVGGPFNDRVDVETAHKNLEAQTSRLHLLATVDTPKLLEYTANEAMTESRLIGSRNSRVKDAGEPTAAEKVINALQVMLKDPKIYAFLEKNDPMALRQGMTAMAAVAMERADMNRCPGCGPVAPDTWRDPLGYCHTCCEEVIFNGYTRQQLCIAFKKVEPAGNWKLPIDATVDGGTTIAQAVIAAIDFFCGGGAHVTMTHPGTSPTPTSFHVKAPGYYALIGA